LRTSFVDAACFFDLRGDETGLAPIQRRTPCINLARLGYHLHTFRRIPGLMHGVVPGHEWTLVCVPCRFAKSQQRQGRAESL